jgi:hypothetical protein
MPGRRLRANSAAGSGRQRATWLPAGSPSYPVNGVSVSNFVTPSWFDPPAGVTAQFDKLGQLPRPFTILKGGYVVYESAGKSSRNSATSSPSGART